jgi:protoheme IX farnesyltransferase
VTIATYLGVYTPLKRVTPLCTLAGAVPGALPPLIGWAGAGQPLGPPAWALFALLFLWQLPHFLAIAVLHREDYARAGMRMLPVVESDGLATARHIVLSGLALLPVSLFPSSVGLAGSVYFYGALALGLGFLAVVLRAALQRSVPACHRLFLASVVYLPALLGLMAWDKRAG